MRKILNILLGFLLLVLTNPVFAQFSVVDTVCAGTRGEEYRVLSTSGSKYFWNVEGGNFINTNNSPNIKVDWGFTPGLKKVIVVEQNNKGCFGDSIITYVWVKPLPSANIVGPQIVCKGEQVSLKALGGPNIMWNTGSTEPELNVAIDHDSAFMLYAFDDMCGIDSALHNIDVREFEVFSFSNFPEVPKIEEEVQFIPQSNDNLLLASWYINDEYFSSDINPHFTFNKPGDYNVKVEAFNKSGCFDSASGLVKVINDAKVFIPTAITSNSDRLNDNFKISYVGIAYGSYTIYSRWGNKVFESQNIGDEWNAKQADGYPIPEGVYVVYIKAIGLDGKAYTFESTLTILK